MGLNEFPDEEHRKNVLLHEEYRRAAAFTPRKPKAAEDFLPLLGRYIKITFPSGRWSAGKLTGVSLWLNWPRDNGESVNMIGLQLNDGDVDEVAEDRLHRYSFEVMEA